jgi:hypothetical protein
MKRLSISSNELINQLEDNVNEYEEIEHDCLSSITKEYICDDTFVYINVTDGLLCIPWTTTHDPDFGTYDIILTEGAFLAHTNINRMNDVLYKMYCIKNLIEEGVNFNA